jgi:hypothetical protein
MVRITLLVLLCQICFRVCGQTIKGFVRNAEQRSISDCSVVAIDSAAGEVLQFTTPTAQGYFELQIKKPVKKILVRCQGLGYQTITIELNLTQEKTVYRQDLILSAKPIELGEVVVLSQRPKIVINNDTVTYDVEKLAHSQDLKMIDLLRHLPGIEVNDQTGQVSYKGKPIETMLLDGDDLFGQGYSIGVRNIPIKIVDKVEAIEDYHSNQLEKGMRRSNQVVLNLKLKKNNPALSGELIAGGGPLHYVGKSELILLSSKSKGLGIGTLNNIAVNETSYSNSTYSSEHASEMRNYAFDPLSNSSLKGVPSFDRSYNNELYFGQYNQHLKIDKKTSIRGDLAFFQDLNRFSINTTSRFSVNGADFFTQSNQLSGINKPLAKALSLVCKTQFSKKTNLSYDLRLVDHSLDAQQNNIQNNHASFASNLDQHQHFFQQNLNYANRFSPNNFFEFKAAQAVDQNNQNFHIVDGVPILYEGIGFGASNLYNQRNSLDLSGSLLKKLPKGDAQVLLSHNQQQEMFVYQPSNLKFTFDYKQQLNQIKSIVNLLLFKKGKLHIEVGGAYTQQKIVNQPSNERISRQQFLWNTALLLEMELSKQSKLLISTVGTANPPASMYLYRAIVMTDSRNLYTNKPSLELIHQWNSSLNYSHHDLLKQSNQRIALNYQQSNNAFFAAQNVDSLVSVSTFFQLPMLRKTWSTTIDHSFLINSLSNLITFQVNAKLDRYFNQLNEGSLASTVQTQTALHIGISSAFKGFFNYRLNADWMYNTYQQANLPTLQMRFIIAELIANFKVTKITNIRLVSHAVLPQEITKIQNQLFFDLFINHRFSKNKMETFLIARNIFNRSNYEQIKTTEFSKTVVSTSLFRPLVVLGLSFSL